MSIVHLGQTGSVGEAPGFAASQVDAGAVVVLVAVVDAAGRLDGHVFGPAELRDLTMFAAWLNARAMRGLDGEL